MYTEQRNESLNRKGNMLGGWDLHIHTAFSNRNIASQNTAYISQGLFFSFLHLN